METASSPYEADVPCDPEWESLRRMQATFLRGVQADPRIPTGALGEIGLDFSFLCAASRHRLEVYRNGHFTRVTAVLADTVFERASHFMGREFVQALLADHFRAHPAASALLTQAVDGFPAFVAGHSEAAPFPYLPDLLRACLSRWIVLTAPDPEPLSDAGLSGQCPDDLASFHLQKHHAFLPSSWPLFDIWNIAANPPGEDAPTAPDSPWQPRAQAQGILFVKSCPYTLETISVPEGLTPLVTALSRGFSVADAIESTESQWEDFDVGDFTRWMALMTERHAFSHVRQGTVGP